MTGRTATGVGAAPTPRSSLSPPEALAAGWAGAAIGATTGWLLAAALDADDHTPLVLGGALVAWANGLIGGARQIYEWRSPRGWLAFVLDSSWALLPTSAALTAHAVARVQRGGGGYVAAWSARQNRHVYLRGLRVRRGFLVTVGNTVNGVGVLDGQRRHIVDDHEQVHVWQARWFGPLFPLLYGGWLVAGTALGVPVWAARRVLHKPGSLRAVVDVLGYYANPFEWWAYSREGRWPPPGAAATWRRPLVSRRTRR